MTDDDTYNGWSNRETWAVNLWLTNNEGIYCTLRERIATARDEWGPDVIDDASFPPWRAGQVVKDYWEEITDPDTSTAEWFVEHILPILLDVGSIWRVDWDEVGAAWLDE